MSRLQGLGKAGVNFPDPHKDPPGTKLFPFLQSSRHRAPRMEQPEWHLCCQCHIWNLISFREASQPGAWKRKRMNGSWYPLDKRKVVSRPWEIDIVCLSFSLCSFLRPFLNTIPPDSIPQFLTCGWTQTNGSWFLSQPTTPQINPHPLRFCVKSDCLLSKSTQPISTVCWEKIPLSLVKVFCPEKHLCIFLQSLYCLNKTDAILKGP